MALSQHLWQSEVQFARQPMYKSADNKTLTRTVFKVMMIGDVEDPEIYAAEPILNWQNSEQGQWVMEHAVDVSYMTQLDYQSYGYKVALYGYLAVEDLTFFKLKWG